MAAIYLRGVRRKKAGRQTDRKTDVWLGFWRKSHAARLWSLVMRMSMRCRQPARHKHFWRAETESKTGRTLNIYSQKNMNKCKCRPKMLHVLTKIYSKSQILAVPWGSMKDFKSLVIGSHEVFSTEILQSHEVNTDCVCTVVFLGVGSIFILLGLTRTDQNSWHRWRGKNTAKQSDFKKTLLI